ncbi:hypothetical protein B5F07_21890 [Lachnoclostridium sp. An169]|uniref:hypothetical protein n=1 Tax=Lachnoclostridium sp. An169 TaxID=1965569 RepID=UPI000B3AFB0C|nr:hypothetical protein [Lachnoclostridium sp. An169]OUP79520.1 hypothetical protein B5F07_21890 [Lachnoclostridium sp. An169]
MEQKHESDLTSKEKRQLEFQKLKSMTFRQKIEYLWTYYKIWLVVLLAVIMVGSIIVTMVQNAMKVELLSIAIVDADMNAQEQIDRMTDDLLDYIGTGDKYETITMDASAGSGDDYTDVTKRMVLLASGTVDLFICNEETYEEYDEQGGFRDWSEILGDDYGQYEQYMTNGVLDLSKSEKWQEYGITFYEPVYAGALAASEKDENLKAFAEFFFE